jgi:hypothetical protein
MSNTIHFGVTPMAEGGDLDALTCEDVQARLAEIGIAYDADSFREWGEELRHGDDAHLTWTTSTDVTPEVVQVVRLLTTDALYGTGLRLLDYAFVTDSADWSQRQRVHLISESLRLTTL